jgi:hypothetical protein
MKTTLELPDKLFAQAKAAAAKRKTTFRAVVEHALRREVGSPTSEENESPFYTIGPTGSPLIKHNGKTVVTTSMVRELLEEE